MITKNKYVFVVCGEDKHIQTLNFSISYLKHFSANEIVVITDKSRNSFAIDHDNIIHVDTPTEYNNHQASIYLKTSLHRYLNMNYNYCYLDSDAIALNKNADSIFNHYYPPVTFAHDHCPINEFSPSAVTCNCRKDSDQKIILLENLIRKFNPYFEKEKITFNPSARELRRVLYSVKKHPLKNFSFILNYLFGMYLLPKKIFKLNNNIYFNRKNKTWCDKNGNIFLYHSLNYYKQVQKQSNFIYKIPQFDWYDKNGERIYSCACNHLVEKIQSKFNINFSDKKWRHWNGGVFLFNKESINFLENWHKHTLNIFDDPDWKTRDQGTLAATAWENNLQNHPVLKREYNFIADFNNPLITFNENKGFTADNFESVIIPSFIHIYHNFGLHGWEIWDAVENIFKINKTKTDYSSNNHIIQSLWIGDTLSNIELLALYSFISHGHIFHLYTYNPIKNNLPEGVVLKDANLIIPSAKVFAYKKTNQFGHGKGSLGGFSDIFRYKLLYEKGGWWVDMDVTCMKSFNFDEDYVFRTHQILKVVGNIMKCPPKSDLMKLCYEQAIYSIDENNRDWHKPIQILIDNIEKLKLDKYIKNISNHDSWNIIRKMVKSKQDKSLNWYAIHWVNEEWRRNKINKNYYKSNSTLGELMLQYNIPKAKLSSLAIIIQKYRLTFIYAAFKQLPGFIRFHLGIKT